MPPEPRHQAASNLRNALVAANSLIPLDYASASRMIFSPTSVSASWRRLIEDATQRHFGARTMRPSANTAI